MLLIMTSNTKMNTVGENPLENQDLNAVCTNLEFSDDKMLHLPRKRCLSTSIILSSSPKKKKKESQNIIPPKKFLLGGSISDPLNLNSLQNEDINKAMNMTPKSSPLHSNTINIKKDQVNVIIPKNLCDPLELSTCDEARKICSDLDLLKQKTIHKFKFKKVLTTSLSEPDLLFENISENNYSQERINFSNEEFSPPNKKSKIESYETNKNNISHVIFEVIEQITLAIENEIFDQSTLDTCNIPVPEIPIEAVTNKVITPCKIQSSPEKIVKDLKEVKKCSNIKSPKDPQSLISDKHCKSQPVTDEPSSSKPKTSLKPKQKVNKNEPKFKEKNALFKYGNYNRYYGYRNPDDEDIRLKVLADRIDLFYGKDVLDIGCNIGHVTFSVARDFGAKSVVGMDIDRKLINIARKNVQYYINDTIQSSYPRLTNYQLDDYTSNSNSNFNSDSFPACLPMLYGPINLPGLTISGAFPYNVSFVQGNYVLESDSMLLMETCKFDVILCLSITKWLHLNWGDDGLKRAFKRMYAQLRPGGILVVEPQPWKSYGRRKTLTETIWRNYKNIQLKPTMFTEYLIDEVGFNNCETLPMPNHPSKGFQRPLKLYRKPNNLVTRNIPNCTIVKPKETQQL